MGVRKLLLQAGVVAAAIGGAAAANATDYGVGFNGPEYFLITPSNTDIFTAPVINAVFGINYSGVSSFDDTINFTIPQNGFGTGSVTSTFVFNTSNLLTFSSILFNGTPLDITSTPTSSGASIAVPITIFANQLNTIQFVGSVTGSAGFSGTAQFVAAAVPEPATWAMMVVGFGVIGAACRRSRATSTKIAFS
jgi:hypothetical protein